MEREGELTVDANEVVKAAQALLPELHASQAGVFYEAIVQPQRCFERITETVEPLVRSLLVKSAYTFQDPPYAAGRTVAIPLFMQRRGTMIDGLAITDSSGNRVSTLGRDATLALEAAVARMFVSLMGTAAETLYKTDIELALIRLLASSDGASVKKPRQSSTKLRRFQR